MYIVYTRVYGRDISIYNRNEHSLGHSMVRYIVVQSTYRGMVYLDVRPRPNQTTITGYSMWSKNIRSYVMGVF
jgi:hypothetical protein